MKEETDRLKKLVKDFFSEFKELDNNITSINLTKNSWSLKEIIGHLIDSASNNHQRFVRFQLSDHLEYPDYNRDDWLKIQKYNSMNFSDLISLFAYFNKLLENIILNIEVKCLQNKWEIDWDESSSFITLEDLIIHYIDHLGGHIIHFKERLTEIKNNT